jgi:hypothetical protein
LGPYSKNTCKRKSARDVVQVVECPPNKHEDQRSNQYYQKKLKIKMKKKVFDKHRESNKITYKATITITQWQS